MPDVKETINLFDDEGDGKIDGTQIGDVIRALGLKPTNAMIEKVAGKKYKRGEARLGEAEVTPMYEDLKKEKEVGTFNDYLEALKVFDKDEVGKITKNELKHGLIALGERLTGDQADEIMDGAADESGQCDYKAFIKKVLAGPA